MNDLNNQEPNQQAGESAFSKSAKQHRSAGKKMLLISWLLILGIGFGFFQWQELKKRGAYNTTSLRTSSGAIEVHIPLTGGDRYEVFGKINNQEVMFLVDTGATIVAIPEKIAMKAGLVKGMPIGMETAGGTSTAYLTKIAVLIIGEDIILRNVVATINPNMPEKTVLLGMRALRQLEFTHYQDKLILRQE